MEINEEIKERCYTEYYRELQFTFENITKKSDKVDGLLLENCKKIRNSFYLIYPFYFAGYFNNMNKRDLYELTLCGNLYFTYLMLLDGIIDGHYGLSYFIIHKLHEKTILKISKLFPSNSIFWKYFEMHGKSFEEGIFREKELSLKPEIPKMTDEDFESITLSKCAFAKCATAGLMSLADSNISEDPFIVTQDKFHIGLQILDDIDDWKEDFRKKRNSYLLDMALSNVELKELLESNKSDKENILGKYIYLSGLTLNQLDKALSYFKSAKQECENLNVPEWIKLIDNYIAKCYELINYYEFLTTQTKARNLHYIKKGTNNFILQDQLVSKFPKRFHNAISYLMLEHENNYLEMMHVMKVPSTERVIIGDPGMLVYGNVFQRTIVADTYLKINSISRGIIDEKIIKKDIDEIISCVQKHVKGGWSYFPEHPYLPPDTDDLAQVIQILVRSRYTKTEELIDKHLGLLLNYNMNSNNTFKTWILDPGDKSIYQEKMKNAVENYWGDYAGRDIEVTANLLYSLLLYAPRRFEEIIKNGIEQILANKTKEGYWPSIWYWGPYYGTYIAVRLIIKYCKNADCLLNTKNFILSTQNNDGGWGLKESDPLNTAVCILILNHIEKVDKDISRDVYNRALNFLINGQQEIGSWKKSPFIKMKIGDKKLTYGSETISTAFVLQAMAKAVYIHSK